VARDEPPLESLARRWVVPPALFAGATAGFLACCVAGWIASGQNLYVDFVRPHMYIAPETSFNPTVSQLRALVADTAPPGRVVVIVGGSSVFHGVGQGPDTIWTRRLQARLGEPFRVFNFAFRAGASSEGGAIVAESFIREGRPVIYVADTPPAVAVPPLGGFYEYLFWDAYYKNLLLDDPVREARIDELTARLAGAAREKLHERRLGARLDHRLRFNDLWTTVGYRWAFTVWNRFTLGRPFAPRKTFAEPDSGASLPFGQRYLESHRELALRIARGFAEGRTGLDPHGRPTADPELPGWRAFRSANGVDLPRRLRQRTLIVVDGQSPYYLDMLGAEERRLYDLVVERTVALLREAGYESVATGPGYAVDDYHDRVHLTASGGAKLADAIAPVIRDMAARLGYVR
jgi:hypothetical protein